MWSTEDGKVIAHECKDDTVSISANSNKVTLTGRCKLVIIDGNNNTVTLAAGINIKISKVK